MLQVIKLFMNKKIGFHRMNTAEFSLSIILTTQLGGAESHWGDFLSPME